MKSTRLFILITIVLIAALVRLYYGLTSGTDIDEAINTFIATRDWEEFLTQIGIDKHPPLFTYLQRLVLMIHNSLLFERLVTMSCGVLSVVFMGRIARKIGLSQTYEYLTMLIVALSCVHIAMSIAIRNYMLCSLLMLISWHYYLDLINIAQNSRFKHRLFFYLATIGALCANYYALLYSVILIAIPGIHAIWDRKYRRGLINAFKQFRTRHFMEALLPLSGFGFFLIYLSIGLKQHFRSGIKLDYLYEHYWQPGQSLYNFIAGGLINEFNLFGPIKTYEAFYLLPLKLQNLLNRIMAQLGWSATHLHACAIIVTTLALILMLWCLFKRRPQKSGQQLVVYFTAPYLFCSVAGALLVLALLGKYPFGGMIRHQFILYPFAVMTLMIILQGMSLQWENWFNRGRTFLEIGFFLIVLLVAKHEVYERSWPVGFDYHHTN